MRHLTRSSSTALVVVVVALLAAPVRAQSAQVDSAPVPTPVAVGTRSTSLRVLPVIGSAPETGFVGGATALRVSSSAVDTLTRPSVDQVYAAYTAKHQFRAFFSTDRWSLGNRWGLSAQLEYQRFPQPFYGIGINAPKTAEEWYEPRSVIASVTVRRKLARATYAQLGYRFSNTTVQDVLEGGAVERGDMLGSRGGIVSQMVGGAAWDSRDNVFASTAGTFAQATVAYAGRELGADFRFARYTADARRYLRLGRGVLAGQVYAEATSGSAPFDQLSLVGSNTVMRGYVRGRYRDRDLAAAQVEYRTPVVGRFGAAVFAGAGTVAPTLSKLASTSVLPSVGAGARWLLLPKQGTTVRVDYAVGRSASGLYIAFNEAF